MRDPKRIPLVLARIQAIWEMHPDLRLGQLLLNSFAPDASIYYLEDDTLTNCVEVMHRGKVDGR